MSIDLLFTISSIFSAVIGLGALLSPALFMGGLVANPVLTDTFRGFGGLFVAVAVLDWMARGTPPSRARNAIVLANTIGFLFATIFTGLAVLHGYYVWGWILVGINALLTIGFFVGALGRMTPEAALEPIAPQPVAERVPTALPARELAEAKPTQAGAKTATRESARKTPKKSARKKSRRV